MKKFIIIGFLTITSVLDAGEAQERFLKAVGDCHRITIDELLAGSADLPLLDTTNAKEISKVISVIELVDPPRQYTPDGDLLVELPPFCVLDYRIRFHLLSAQEIIYGVYGCGDLALPPPSLQLEHAAAIPFSKFSSMRFKRLIKSLQKNGEVNRLATSRLRVRK